MPKILRITTVPISLKLLLTGQMQFMQSQGWQVLMVSADGPERKDVMEAEDCPHVIIPFTRAITPWQDLQCLWQLILLMREWRPDVVHTHTPKAGLLGMLAARLTGVPVRIHTIAGLPFMTASGFRKKLLQFIERLTYWGAQHVWPNSQSMLRYVQSIQLCPEHKLDVISAGSTNGIDLNVFSQSQVGEKRRSVVKSQIRFETKSTYLMSIGRVVKDKGIPEVVAAFKTLYEERPYLRLILVGPLEEERAEELLPTETLTTIRKHVAIQHIGWTDDVAAFLCLTDILVHASHREGFPNVPLQAGAMECPIVCSAIPGNVDIVEHGQTGQTYSVGDSKALQEAITQCLDNRQAAQDMAQKLRQRIEYYFARPKLHEALLKRYEELVEG